MTEIRVTEQGAGNNNPGGPDDPAVARAEIQQTRARMSDTIEEIEQVLVRKKSQVQNRLDVLSPIRERPLPSLGAAFGAGLLLGVITGGGGDDHEHHEDEGRPSRRSLTTSRGEWDDRAEHWEARARRLLSIAQEQEKEIRDLEVRFGEMRAEALERSRTTRERSDYDTEYEYGTGQRDDLRSTVGSLRGTIAGGITGFLSDTLHHLMEGRTGSRA